MLGFGEVCYQGSKDNNVLKGISSRVSGGLEGRELARLERRFFALHGAVGLSAAHMSEEWSELS